MSWWDPCRAKLINWGDPDTDRFPTGLAWRAKLFLAARDKLPSAFAPAHALHRPRKRRQLSFTPISRGACHELPTMASLASACRLSARLARSKLPHEAAARGP